MFFFSGRRRHARFDCDWSSDVSSSDLHSLILTAAMTNIGMQCMSFWAFAALVSAQTGLLPLDSGFDAFRRYFTLERCLVLGTTLVVLGLSAGIYALLYWYRLSFGEIPGDLLIKVVCAASFLMVLGFQLIFSSFFFFQAEDGIRDLTVTGVQTCALPI